MSRTVPPARATHYRLSAETWALIAEEYSGGASAKEVAAKWKVSAGSVYRRACLDGFTKAAVGDARARENAARVEAGEAEAEAEAPAKTRRRRPAPYKRKGQATWDLIAELYLAGAPARVLAERYGVTADNIWRRARRHGWSKPRKARARERAKGQGVVLEDLLVPPLDPFDEDPGGAGRQPEPGGEGAGGGGERRAGWQGGGDAGSAGRLHHRGSGGAQRASGHRPRRPTFASGQDPLLAVEGGPAQGALERHGSGGARHPRGDPVVGALGRGARERDGRAGRAPARRLVPDGAGRAAARRLWTYLGPDGEAVVFEVDAA